LGRRLPSKAFIGTEKYGLCKVLMTTESKISLECLRGDHQERCLSQDHCSCKCDDPVGLDVDTDEVIKDQIEAVDTWITKGLGTTNILL
jgi:hypothetical protein